MKKIALMIVLVLLALCLAGCGAEVERQTQAQNIIKSIFVIVEDTYDWKIVYDRETKVMYAVSDGTYNQGNFTVLVNADGTPKLWEGGK